MGRGGLTFGSSPEANRFPRHRVAPFMGVIVCFRVHFAIFFLNALYAVLGCGAHGKRD